MAGAQKLLPIMGYLPKIRRARPDLFVRSRGAEKPAVPHRSIPSHWLKLCFLDEGYHVAYEIWKGRPQTPTWLWELSVHSLYTQCFFLLPIPQAQGLFSPAALVKNKSFPVTSPPTVYFSLPKNGAPLSGLYFGSVRP